LTSLAPCPSGGAWRGGARPVARPRERGRGTRPSWRHHRSCGTLADKPPVAPGLFRHRRDAGAPHPRKRDGARTENWKL